MAVCEWHLDVLKKVITDFQQVLVGFILVSVGLGSTFALYLICSSLLEKWLVSLFLKGNNKLQCINMSRTAPVAIDVNVN